MDNTAPNFGSIAHAISFLASDIVEETYLYAPDGLRLPFWREREGSLCVLIMSVFPGEGKS